MIMFLISGISLIGMIVFFFYLAIWSDRLGKREKAVILPNYVVAIVIVSIIFSLSVWEVAMGA